jgi:hypothetical protein
VSPSWAHTPGAILGTAIGLFVLFPAGAYGASADLNGLPIFWAIANNNPAYRDACFKAQEAFFLQTGVTPTYNKLNNYVTNKANKAISVIIDNNTPFSAKTVYTVIGTVYYVGVKKQLTRTFRNPFWPKIQHTVSIGQTSSSLDIRIPF